MKQKRATSEKVKDDKLAGATGNTCKIGTNKPIFPCGYVFVQVYMYYTMICCAKIIQMEISMAIIAPKPFVNAEFPVQKHFYEY